MISVIKRMVVASLFLVAVSAVHANNVNYAGYALDDSKDIVTGGGLEWLQWDVTAGQSISSAVAAASLIDGGVWTVASNEQVSKLFNDFDFGYIFDANESVGQYPPETLEFRGTEAENPFNAFTRLFGSAGVNTDYIVNGEGSFAQSLAFFGADLNTNGRYNVAIVADDYQFGSGVGTYTVPQASLSEDRFAVNSTDASIGVALVRTAPQSVPEPSAIALMALGLIGLGVARRKQNKG